MGTTTKMAIPYPEATGLVKDGWEDMKDIATQVDAKSGLVLLNTTTFTAAASVSLPTNTFSSNYQFYYLQGIIYADSTVSIRLRASGTDNTTASSYEREFGTADAGTTGASYLADNLADIGYGRSGEKISLEMFIYDVNLAAKTYISTKTIRPKTNMQIYTGGIVHTQTVAYDSMTFISGAGNFGVNSKVSVFGVNI